MTIFKQITTNQAAEMTDSIMISVGAAYLDPETSEKDALAILVDNQIDDQLTFHRVSRNVNRVEYERTDTKMPLVNSL